MRILIADDDQDQLAVRSLMLRRSGFETLEAADLPSALQLAAVHNPKCAVVDLRFPTADIGVELVRKLKNLNAAMHIFLLTGGDPVLWSQRLEKGLVDEVVVKGCSAPHLIERLKALASI